MPGKTSIEWTDDSWRPVDELNESVTLDRGGRRVRRYDRKNPDKPGRRVCAFLAQFGLAWCRDCHAWGLRSETTSDGRCRLHSNQRFRERYAANRDREKERIYARKERRQGLTPMPSGALELHRERLGTDCVYCGAPATGWDHVIPVSRGGDSVPWNLVPACVSCNSLKKDRPLDEWLIGRQSPSYLLAEALVLEYC